MWKYKMDDVSKYATMQPIVNCIIVIFQLLWGKHMNDLVLNIMS